LLLILKLTIVPLGLLVFGIVERLHGPRVAGWLAASPIVGGPILVFVTLAHGTAFGASAARGAYFGLMPWFGFTMSYAVCARRLSWLWCTLVGISLWALVASLTVRMQAGPRWLDVLPFAAYVLVLFVYPRGAPSDEEREHVWWGLPARMIAGTVLTIGVTEFATVMGSHWAGAFATFPVMGSTIFISSHLQYGRHAVQEAVAGMSVGLASVGTFCFVSYLLLSMMSMWGAFGLAMLACFCAHALTWLMFKVR
jgi:hypothetical protein